MVLHLPGPQVCVASWSLLKHFSTSRSVVLVLLRGLVMSIGFTCFQGAVATSPIVNFLCLDLVLRDKEGESINEAATTLQAVGLVS